MTRLFTTQMEAGLEHERLSKLMSQSHQKQLATDLQEQEIQNTAAARNLALQKQQMMGGQDIRLTI